MPDPFPVRLMIYWAGDAAGLTRFGRLDDFISRQLQELSQVASNDIVVVSYQLDGTTDPTRRAILLPATNPRAAELSMTLVESNSGDPQELISFVQWTQAACAGTLNVLALSGHGLAFQDQAAADALSSRGFVVAKPDPSATPSLTPRRFFGRRSPNRIASMARRLVGRPGDGGADPGSRGILDGTKAVLVDGSSSDFLTNFELATAMRGTCSLLGQSVDVLVFDACLMASIEILTDMTASAKVFVGCLDELSASGLNFRGAVERVTSSARSGDPLNASVVAKALVQSFSPAASFDSCIAVDLNCASFAAGLDAFGDFVASIAAWIGGPTGDRAARITSVRKALGVATDLVKYHNRSMADLGSLVPAFTTAGMDLPMSVIEPLRVAVNLLRSAVLGKNSGASYSAESCIGISIFVPRSLAELAYNSRDYLQLTFSERTGWGRLLQAIWVSA